MPNKHIPSQTQLQESSTLVRHFHVNNIKKGQGNQARESGG